MKKTRECGVRVGGGRENTRPGEVSASPGRAVEKSIREISSFPLFFFGFHPSDSSYS